MVKTILCWYLQVGESSFIPGVLKGANWISMSPISITESSLPLKPFVPLSPTPLAPAYEAEAEDVSWFPPSRAVSPSHGAVFQEAWHTHGMG